MAQTKLLIPPRVLALPNSTGSMTLDIYACTVKVDCVLPQEQYNEASKPFGYWSRLVKEAERKHSTTQRESLSKVCSVLLLGPYLEKRRFTNQTTSDSPK